MIPLIAKLHIFPYTCLFTFITSALCFKSKKDYHELFLLACTNYSLAITLSLHSVINGG